MYLYTMIKFDNSAQAQSAIEMAIGRIFLLGSRSFQNGDIKSYEDARHIAFEAAEYLGLSLDAPAHSYQADYHKIHHD